MKKFVKMFTVIAMLSVFLVACTGGGAATEAATEAAATEATATEAAATEATTEAATEAAKTEAPAAGAMTGPITVVSREEGSGTRGAFVEIVGILDDNKNDMTTQTAIIQNGTDAVMTTVANSPEAVGYISLGSLNDTVKPLKIAGVEATDANIKAGQYPIARPFNIATKGTPDALTQDFINFMMSKEGQAIAGEKYISVDDAAPEYKAGENLSGTIQVGGSTSVAPLVESLAEEYMKLNTGVTVDIQATGSSAGMTAAIDGIVQIGMASRELSDDEKAELTPLVIANDGIAVIVNTANPTEDITMDHVKQIFLGEALMWEDLK